MMWFLDARVLVENGLYYGAGAYAAWRGGPMARLVALALLLENSIGLLIGDPVHAESPRFVTLALDLAVLGAILYVAFATDFRWPLLASALQILSILTFVARIIDPTILSWTYVTVDISISFALMATVVYGAVQHPRAPPPH